MHTVGITIHNQENIIERNMRSIINNMSHRVTQFIVNFDGCTDSSESIVHKVLSEPQYKSWLSTIEIDYIIDDNVFETTANNNILKKVKNPYCLLLQDDIQILEAFWDMKLVKPLTHFKDIWAVSGRNAHNLDFFSNPIEIFYPNVTGDGTIFKNKNILYLRQVINRGPISINMDKFRMINFFDEEFCPQNQDDHDACLRMWFEYKMRCANYNIDFFSNPSDGGTRKPTANTWIYPAIVKNWKLMRERYEFIYKNHQNRIPKDEERMLIF